MMRPIIVKISDPFLARWLGARHLEANRRGIVSARSNDIIFITDESSRLVFAWGVDVDVRREVVPSKALKKT
jgi:hypothetical protein